VTESGRRPAYALIVANAISLLSSTLTVVAIPWFVLETTGSAGRAGLSGAFAFLPAFFAGIIGGALVDRIGARRVAMLADLVSGSAILMIPVLYHTIGLRFWQLLVLVLAGSLFDIPGLTARRSLLPELASMGRLRLERVNAFLEGNNQIAILIGPPVAGVLIGFFGAANVLWLDAASSFVSLLAVLLLVPANIQVRARQQATGFVADLREGLRFLWRDKVIRAIAASLATANAFGAPFFSLMFAVYAKRRFDDARYLGLMLSVAGVGLVLGTVAYGWLVYRLPRRLVLIFSYLTFSLAMWPLVFDLPFLPLLILIGIGGFFDGPINPLLVTVRLERIPIEMRGRVFAATSAFAQLFPPMTIGLAGLMIERVGLRETMVFFASGSLISGVLMAIHPIWKRLDESAPAPASA
jgi:MFS family permease